MIGAAQALAQNLNSMTDEHPTAAHPGGAGHRQRRADGQHRVAADRPDQPAARRRRPADSSTATLEDQRDQDITQLSPADECQRGAGPNNQISVFTGTGQQLVAGPQASQLQFDNAGTLTATSLWSANPSQDGAGTITLTSPSGTTTDLVATNAHPVGPDRRLPADARHHPAAGADPARRVGQPDVAGAVEPDDERDRGDRRARSPASASTSAACCRATPSSSPIPMPAIPSTPSPSWRWVPAARCRRRTARQSEQPGDRSQFLRRHELRSSRSSMPRSAPTCNSPIRPAPCCRSSTTTAAATSSIRCRRPRPPPR